MSIEVLSFGTEIEKRTIHHRKNLILLDDVAIANILISSMISSGGKKL